MSEYRRDEGFRTYKNPGVQEAGMYVGALLSLLFEVGGYAVDRVRTAIRQRIRK